jgi:hypothetical protein
MLPAASQPQRDTTTGHNSKAQPEPQTMPHTLMHGRTALYAAALTPIELDYRVLYTAQHS